MLKYPTATATATAAAIHRSRITLASVSTPGPGPGSSTAKMSAAQPRVSSEHAGEIKQQRPQGPPSTYFPLGYKDAAYQWWTSVSPVTAERNVLSFMPRLQEAANASTSTVGSAHAIGTPIWRRSMVQLSGANRALNELSIERSGEEPEETLVMVHGYGAGLGFFYKNFEPMSRIPGLKLYALDMLGMGNSSRPPFKIRARTREEQVIEAENWFIDALEEWRKERKIERFTLLGHSLGGYLAVSYALKYPGHLNKLILASPVGIPKDPYAVNAAMPEPGESTLAQEFTQDQQSVTSESNPATATLPKAAVAAGAAAPAAAPKRPLPGWLVWLWDANISPFSIVRMSGPLGPRFVSGWSSRRFNHLPTDEAQALHDYSFSIFKQKGSGEYALAYILAPGAYARRPVIDRIQDVGRQVITPAAEGRPAKKELGIPVVFMYGEHDWMDAAGGLAAEEKLKQARTKALLHGTDEEKRGENGSAKVVIVPKAGHHLYLDNPDFFNDFMKKEMERTLTELRRKKLTES